MLTPLRIVNRVVRSMVRRAQELFASLDIEGAELHSAAAAILCGIVLALPGDYLQSNPALVELARHAPEAMYTTLMFVVGVSQLSACLLGGIPSEFVNSRVSRTYWLWVRLRSMQFGVALWVLMAVLLWQGGGYLGVVFFGLAACDCVYGSHRLSKNIRGDQHADEGVRLAKLRQLDVSELEIEPSGVSPS